MSERETYSHNPLHRDRRGSSANLPVPSLMSRVLFYLWMLIAVALAMVIFQAAPAHADVQCGQAVCSVDSQHRTESNWREEVQPSPPAGNPTGTPTYRYLYSYEPCGGWHRQGSFGAQSVRSYPAQESGTYTCLWGSYSVGQGTGEACPPRSDRASNGRINVYVFSPTRGKFIYAFYTCAYPTDAYAPWERVTGSGKVYTGGRGSFYQTPTPTDAQQATSNGVLTADSGYISRSVDLTNPEAYTGAWTPNFRAETGVYPNGVPRYGFYRLLWQLDYRTCLRWEWNAWLGLPPRYDCSHSGTDWSSSAWTYACNYNPALRQGIATTPQPLFNPALCQPDWNCQATSPFLVYDGEEDVIVLRDGMEIDVSIPQPAVSHGASIRHPDNWRMRLTVKDGSTPLKPNIDLNDRGQYFKATWEWGKWVAYSPDHSISFNWHSTPGRPFIIESDYAFSAEFYLPRTDAIGGDTYYEWVRDTAVCGNPSSSPAITVVRGTNSPSR